MWLTGDGAPLGVRKSGGYGIRCSAQPGRLVAVDHQRRNLDASDPRPRQRVVTHDGRVVDERVGDGLLRSPERRLPHGATNSFGMPTAAVMKSSTMSPRRFCASRDTS